MRVIDLTHTINEDDAGVSGDGTAEADSGQQL